MLPPLLCHWGLPPPPWGSCSCSSLTSLMKFGSPPLPCTSFAPRLGFCTVSISLSSFTVGTELSNHVAKYLSVSATWSYQATLRLVTSAPCPRCAFRKALAAVTLVGPLKRLDCLPSLSFLHHHLGLHPIARLPLHPFPALHLLSWHLTAPHSAVDLRSLYKNQPRLCPSCGPSLMPLWHILRRPLIRVTCTHHLILPSGTLRPPVLLRCAGPYSHFLAQADTRQSSDVNFLCLGFIHLLCFYTFVLDVTKGSPFFPACFIPLYFLRMYEYVRRIRLGDRPDVRLASYKRDLGVWMFPGVRRVRFLLAIALKFHAVFVPFVFFFFFFLNHKIIVLGYKVLHAAYAMA